MKHRSTLVMVTLLVLPLLLGLFACYLPNQVCISINDGTVSTSADSIGNFSTITGLDYLWELGLDGTGVRVAILDSGIDDTHVDLDDLDDNGGTIDPKVVLAQSYVTEPTPEIGDLRDYHGHGTHVAGIVSATDGGSNGEFGGIANQTELMNVKVINQNGDGYESWVISGVQYAVSNGADIIVMSLGGITNDPTNSMNEAVINAWKSGVVVVCAGGNDGGLGYHSINSPADAMDVIAVGGTTTSGSLASFSSWGPNANGIPKPDVLAPSVDIVSTVSSDSADASSPSVINKGGNLYIPKSGTSMACPFVAGGIALLLEAFPSANPDTIKASLIASAIDLDINSYQQGAGSVNFTKAYELLNDVDWIPLVMLPRRLIDAPFAYNPMGQVDVPMLLIAGQSIGNPYFEVSGDIAPYVILPSLTTFSGQIAVTMTFTSDLNVLAGTYEGTIIIKSGDGTVLDSLDVSFASEGFSIGLIILIVLIVIGIAVISFFFLLRITDSATKDTLCEKFGILCPKEPKE